MPEINYCGGVDSLGTKKGFKVDPETGVTDKLEYSVFLEKAEELLDKIRVIKKEIKRLENQSLSERSGLQSETLKDLWQEIVDCEEIIKHPQTNESYRKRLEKNLKKLEQDIMEIEARVGLPDLQRQVNEFTAKVQELISHDKFADSALRNMSKKAFRDINI